MTTNDRFGQTLSTWLHEEAEHRVPDHLTEVLMRTVATRQRRWWSSPERWLPMRSTARFSPVPRGALVLVVIGLVLALGAASLLVGARLISPPASPFRADSRGSVLYGTPDGDIHVLDTATNQSRALITGAALDGAPLASPNGAVFAFERHQPGSAAATLMVANADGSDIRPFEGAPQDVVGMEWSPEGDRLAISGQVAGAKGLWILGLDGTRTLVQAERPGESIALIREPHWLPGGQELVFLGGPLDTVAPVGLYVVAADGGGLRPIIEPAVVGPAQPAVSPDGATVAFAQGVDGQARLHLVDIASGSDTIVAADDTASDQRPRWSPDGRSLAFERYHGGTYRMALASVDDGQVTEVGPTQPYRSGGSEIRFAPDGSRIVVFFRADGSTWVIDPTDGSAVRMSDDVGTPLSWQPEPD